MKRIIWILFLSLSLVMLVACGSAEGTVPDAAVAPVEAAAPAPPPQDEAVASESEAATTSPGETLLDEQGAVAVAVTPRNLDPGATALDFEVAMNTHSVVLRMDLSQQATLTTDTGLQGSVSGWDAPQGGHHVSGVLSFPALGEDGHFLDGATTLTLTLTNVDAAERSFTWRLK